MAGNKAFTIKRSTAYKWLAVVALCQGTLFQYIEVIIGKLPFVSVFQNMFFPVVYFLLIILAFDAMKLRYLRAGDIFLFMFLFLSVLLSAAIYPENAEYIVQNLRTYILPCIPFFLLGISFDAADSELTEFVSTVCCVAIIVSTLYVFYYIGGGRSLNTDNGSGYSMYWSYLLLPNTMVALEYAFSSKRKLPIICGIVGIVYAFAMGTRGAIVVLFVFLAVEIWRHIQLRAGYKVLFLGVAGIALYMFYASPAYITILVSFRDILQKYNLSTRIIDFLVSGEMVSYTSGRDIIYDTLMTRLWDHPLRGYGVYGEWPLGFYSAHNMYIEVLFHFGFLIGGILMVSYIVTIIKGLKCTENTKAQGWVILFTCLVFIKGIFGGRYMEYPVFFLLGICLQFIRRYKQNEIPSMAEVDDGEK